MDIERRHLFQVHHLIDLLGDADVNFASDGIVASFVEIVQAREEQVAAKKEFHRSELSAESEVSARKGEGNEQVAAASVHQVHEGSASENSLPVVILVVGLGCKVLLDLLVLAEVHLLFTIY